MPSIGSDIFDFVLNFEKQQNVVKFGEINGRVQSIIDMTHCLAPTAWVDFGRGEKQIWEIPCWVLGLRSTQEIFFCLEAWEMWDLIKRNESDVGDIVFESLEVQIPLFCIVFSIDKLLITLKI